MSTKHIFPQLGGIAALALLFTASPGWAQGSQGSSTMPSSSGSSTTTQSTTTTSAPSAPLSRSDAKMMEEMAQANLAEIATAKLALTKTQNEKVRTFAQKMVDDHTLALQDLQQLAQKKGVTLPTEADSKHQAMMSKLEKLSGTAFDQRYMAQGGLSEHQQTHQLLQRVQSRAQDAELKAAAGKTLGVVNEHLASAQQLQRNKGATSTGASGTSGTGASSTSKNAPSGSAGSSGTSGTSGSSNTQSNPQGSGGYRY